MQYLMPSEEENVEENDEDDKPEKVDEKVNQKSTAENILEIEEGGHLNFYREKNIYYSRVC